MLRKPPVVRRGGAGSEEEKMKYLKQINNGISAVWDVELQYKKTDIEITTPIGETAIKSKDIITIMKKVIGTEKPCEVFYALYFDGQNRIIGCHKIDEGTPNQANPLIRTIITGILVSCTPAFVVVHNHPSGNPNPTKEDKIFTQDLKTACGILNIKLLDHIIIGTSIFDNKYFSFLDNNILE